MTTRISDDDFKELDWGFGGDRGRADTLVAWVSDPEFVLDEDVDPLGMLELAGEDFAGLGEWEDAEKVALLAEEVDPGGDRGAYVAALTRMEVAAAREDLKVLTDVADGLARRRLRDADIHTRIGELLEGCGELTRAERWFTRGILVGEAAGTKEYALLTTRNGRRRVRRALGRPTDAMDEEGDAVRARINDWIRGEEG
ncbi:MULTISPECIES: hypothetical protein [Actinomyces]|uniref:hypothetical protein n=1 Tax=Actinomyces TaxID=1654 RepID=UPI0005BADBFA|nr:MULTISPECIES: hypothetical protein [Actinomyces]